MELIRQMLAAAGVLLLLAATFWWMRRTGRAGPRAWRGSRGRRLEAVERLPLGPQHSLHLVRVAGRGLLLAASPAGCSLLESFDWAALERGAPAAEVR
jgi:flagellar biosynthetic protein FliO